MKLKTGIENLDEIIGGGIESGSRNLIYGPVGTGKTVFAMQFLWKGLQEGETVAYDVMDKPFSRLISYFKSFGWNIEPFIEQGKFIAIQAFPHFDPYPKDPRVVYFDINDFKVMQYIDKCLSERKVTRFAAGDFSEQKFAVQDWKTMEPIEDWTINWSHYDNIVNFDVVTKGTEKDSLTQKAIDVDLNKAHNIIYFRFNEEKLQREFRIVKMEGCEHPLEWIPFKITKKGMQLLKQF